MHYNEDQTKIVIDPEIMKGFLYTIIHDIRHDFVKMMDRYKPIFGTINELYIGITGPNNIQAIIQKQFCDVKSSPDTTTQSPVITKNQPSIFNRIINYFFTKYPGPLIGGAAPAGEMSSSSKAMSISPKAMSISPKAMSISPKASNKRQNNSSDKQQSQKLRSLNVMDSTTRRLDFSWHTNDITKLYNEIKQNEEIQNFFFKNILYILGYVEENTEANILEAFKNLMGAVDDNIYYTLFLQFAYIIYKTNETNDKTNNEIDYLQDDEYYTCVMLTTYMILYQKDYYNEIMESNEIQKSTDETIQKLREIYTVINPYMNEFPDFSEIIISPQNGGGKTIKDNIQYITDAIARAEIRKKVLNTKLSNLWIERPCQQTDKNELKKCQQTNTKYEIAKKDYMTVEKILVNRPQKLISLKKSLNKQKQQKQQKQQKE